MKFTNFLQTQKYISNDLYMKKENSFKIRKIKPNKNDALANTNHFELMCVCVYEVHTMN